MSNAINGAREIYKLNPRNNIRILITLVERKKKTSAHWKSTDEKKIPARLNAKLLQNLAKKIVEKNLEVEMILV